MQPSAHCTPCTAHGARHASTHPGVGLRARHDCTHVADRQPPPAVAALRAATAAVVATQPHRSRDVGNLGQQRSQLRRRRGLKALGRLAGRACTHGRSTAWKVLRVPASTRLACHSNACMATLQLQSRLPQMPLPLPRPPSHLAPPPGRGPEAPAAPGGARTGRTAPPQQRGTGSWSPAAAPWGWRSSGCTAAAPPLSAQTPHDQTRARCDLCRCVHTMENAAAAAAATRLHLLLQPTLQPCDTLNSHAASVRAPAAAARRRTCAPLGRRRGVQRCHCRRLARQHVRHAGVRVARGAGAPREPDAACSQMRAHVRQHLHASRTVMAEPQWQQGASGRALVVSSSACCSSSTTRMRCSTDSPHATCAAGRRA